MLLSLAPGVKPSGLLCATLDQGYQQNYCFNYSLILPITLCSYGDCFTRTELLPYEFYIIFSELLFPSSPAPPPFIVFNTYSHSINFSDILAKFSIQPPVALFISSLYAYVPYLYELLVVPLGEIHSAGPFPIIPDRGSRFTSLFWQSWEELSCLGFWSGQDFEEGRSPHTESRDSKVDPIA